MGKTKAKFYLLEKKILKSKQQYSSVLPHVDGRTALCGDGVEVAITG